MPVAGAHAAGDRRPDRFPSIVLDEALATAGVDQTVDDVLSGKFAAGDELRQNERAAIERMVATAGSGAGERFDLALERGATVGVGLATWSGDVRERALRDQLRAGARQLHQPIGRDRQLIGGVLPDVQGPARVDARRHDDIATVATRMDTGANSCVRGRRDRPVVPEPQMSAATGDDFARRRQCSFFGLQSTQGCFAGFAINIENPDPGNSSGWNADVAIGDAPVAPNGFRIGPIRLQFWGFFLQYTGTAAEGVP